jgi:hypothetical protein
VVPEKKILRVLWERVGTKLLLLYALIEISRGQKKFCSITRGRGGEVLRGDVQAG